MIDKVGETAGKIFQFLEKNGEVSVLKLKTGLKLSNSLVCMGLGWLAREDKLGIKDAKKDVKVSLK
ncbi:MAG: winged helix-turn-helix domain-containing protein [Elusimicrobia bacterium]|nr:winged helix-turn-helix domain-containing protein [Elusimicrobiota bacterium]